MDLAPAPVKPLFALVDCNNFYVSCERAFQPHLNGKPVVVLSNKGSAHETEKIVR